jgi:hypothetical protein
MVLTSARRESGRSGGGRQDAALGGRGDLDGLARSGIAWLAMADPFWTDRHGNRLPLKPCPKCGANVGPMPLRVENLRHLGWQPYMVQNYQSWCGHAQEIIPFPRRCWEEVS